MKELKTKIQDFMKKHNVEELQFYSVDSSLTDNCCRIEFLYLVDNKYKESYFDFNCVMNHQDIIKEFDNARIS